MAVFHNDGGMYTATHGNIKATADHISLHWDKKYIRQEPYCAGP